MTFIHFMHNLLFCRTTVYLRGAGGFSKSSQPYSYTSNPSNQTSTSRIPKSQPFAVFEECTQPSQACMLIESSSILVFSLHILLSDVIIVHKLYTYTIDMVLVFDDFRLGKMKIFRFSLVLSMITKLLVSPSHLFLNTVFAHWMKDLSIQLDGNDGVWYWLIMVFYLQNSFSCRLKFMVIIWFLFKKVHYEALMDRQTQLTKCSTCIK